MENYFLKNKNILGRLYTTTFLFVFFTLSYLGPRQVGLVVELVPREVRVLEARPAVDVDHGGVALARSLLKVRREVDLGAGLAVGRGLDGDLPKGGDP